jgi:hypothetical protein
MSFVTEALDFVAKLFGSVPARIKEFAEKAIPVVNKIKEALVSGVVEDILNLIPGDIDDNIRDEAVKLLSGMTSILTEISGMDVDEQVKASAKAGVYLKMSSKLVEIMDGKKLKPNRYDIYTQTVYSKQKG